MTLDPEALEKASETHWLAINRGSRSPWAEIEAPIREEIRALIRADVAAYLDALVASGRAETMKGFGFTDDGYHPIDPNEESESPFPVLIIRLDGDEA